MSKEIAIALIGGAASIIAPCSPAIFKWLQQCQQRRQRRRRKQKDGSKPQRPKPPPR